jgi:hypothetical protein
MMETRTQYFSLDLAPGSVYQVSPARGARIHVKLGQIWLTEEGRLEDQILGADAQHAVQGDGAVVIEALTVTRLIVESDAGVAAVTRQFAKRLWARLAHAVHDRVRHIHLGEPHRAH